MLAFVLEAALRSLLMALAVWGAIRLLRVQAVVAQKLAWVLVLMAAATMPFVMRAPWLALDKALAIPTVAVEKLPGMQWLTSHLPSSSVDAAEPAQPVARKIELVQNAGKTVLTIRPKPSPAHVSGSHSSQELLLMSGEPDAHISARATQNSSEDLTESIEILSATPTRANASAALASAIKTVSPAVHDPAHFWSWQRVRAVAFAIYFGGVALLLVRMTIGLSIALRIWRRARPLPIAGQLAASSIRVSPDLNSPVTIGSTVILPSDYAEWDEDKLRVVLAHEQSHVRQGDFYLQLAAALYAAAFWFSPLGWWLQRKISELGEALSDCAGLEQAKDAASYAQILLEFAALPRTSPFTGALTGVAMARTSNLSGRIERILNDRRFRVAFLGGRRHAVLTAVLVPAALVATVACIRIVPSAHAASLTMAAQAGQSTPVAPKPPAAPDAAAVPAPAPQAIAPSAPDVAVPAPPAVVPDVAVAPDTAVVPDVPDSEKVEPDDAEAAEVEVAPAHGGVHSFSYGYGQSSGGRDESFAIVNGHDTNVNMNGDSHSDFEKAKAKYHDHFIWFERNGKSYVITDPAIVAQAEQMFATDPKIKVQQKDLQLRMKLLEGEMKAVTPMNLKIDVNTPEFKHRMEELQLRLKDLDKIKIDVNTPEFKVQMEKMQLDMQRLNDVKVDLNLHDFQQQMGKLQGDLGRIDAIKIKAMAEKINAEVQTQVNTEVQSEVRENLQEQIGEMQSHMGEVQSQIGDIQGMIGDQQGRLGEKQGEIGERMGKVGEQMGKLGEQQGKHAEAAARRMQSVLDQAVKDGRAKPIE